MQVARDSHHASYYERLKLLFLGGAFFAIIASYTIIKELKDSLFISIVGSKAYVPYAKLGILFGLIPLILIYGTLVDKMRRYQLLCMFSLIYSVIGFMCAAVVSYYGIGAENVSQSKLYWAFGWVYFFYIETFSPFVVSVFWAFLNSITSPDGAKKNYGFLISCSKMGGMFTAGTAWLLLAQNKQFGLNLTETNIHLVLMVASSTLLLTVPVIITMMMKYVPGNYLHGYEASYQFEKQQGKSGKDETGMWSGLAYLVRYPYAFGIFCSYFFYEIISAVLSYMRLGIAQEISCDVSGVSCFLFKLVFFTHFLGLVISVFGTRIIYSQLDERLSLMVMPVVMGSLLLYLAFTSSPSALIAAFVGLRSLYYAFNQPVTEALYIPTVKTMKFKTKSWIDTFGRKMARATGSGFNIFASTAAGGMLAGPLYVGFFGSIIICWVCVSYFLGNKFHHAVKRGEVIGSEQ